MTDPPLPPSLNCHRPEAEGRIDGGAESLVPPYWSQSHRRYESYSSVQHAKPPPITLEDHTTEDAESSYEQNGANVFWAKGVTVDDYVLVSGTLPSVGSFVVWNCRIEMIDVSSCSFEIFAIFFIFSFICSYFGTDFCGLLLTTTTYSSRAGPLSYAKGHY